MKGPRITIAALVALIAFCAVGLAALRNPHEIWSSALFTASLALVLTATLGARRNREWLGYATFGWSYLIVAFGPWPGNRTTMPPLLPWPLVDAAMDAIQGHPASYAAIDEDGKGGMVTNIRGVRLVVALGPSIPSVYLLPYRRVCHSLGAVAFGLLGAVAATLTAKTKGDAP